jgi:ParB family chromosome partitioning protein
VQRSKTPPKGASIFIADCLIREPALISDYHGAGTTAQLLGVEPGAALRKLVTDLAPTGDPRAQVLTLAVVLGSLEARTAKDSWRFGGRGFGDMVRAGDFLAYLVANGYEPSEVERVITGESAKPTPCTGRSARTKAADVEEPKGRAHLHPPLGTSGITIP